MNIQDRLKKVAAFAKGERLADIGSDHAYLPIYMAKQGKIKFAIAGEIVEGPHQSSVKNVAENQLSHIIKCKKAAGLDAISLEDNIDVITICGMGGKLIADILEAGKEKLANHPRLVLQANVAEKMLREKLEDLDYNIIEEDIIEEDGHIYEIIVATKGRMQLDDKEKRFGRFLPNRQSAVFIKKYKQEIEKIDYILSQLEKSAQNNQEKIAYLQKEKNMIKNILNIV